MLRGDKLLSHFFHFFSHKGLSVLVLLSSRIVPANSGDLFLIRCWLESCVCNPRSHLRLYDFLLQLCGLGMCLSEGLKLTQIRYLKYKSRQVDVKNYFSIYSASGGLGVVCSTSHFLIKLIMEELT